MALDMLDAVERAPSLARQGINIHIGTATGPAIAGVIGSRRAVYDLWGDTVKMASRLTDLAKVSDILVDDQTHKWTQQHLNGCAASPEKSETDICVSPDYAPGVAYRTSRNKRQIQGVSMSGSQDR